jgi:hypothetical protein
MNGSVSDVEMMTSKPLIDKAVFSSISTFETPLPSRKRRSAVIPLWYTTYLRAFNDDFLTRL